MRIETVLHALQDPNRLVMLQAIAMSPDGVACGEADLPVSKSTRTYHVRTLREAGVISTRAEGNRRVSTLRRDDLEALYPGLVDCVLSAAARQFPESSTRPEELARP